MLEQLKSLEDQINVKNQEMKVAIAEKENLFKSIAEDITAKLQALKTEFNEQVDKVASEYRAQIDDLMKQRDEVEAQLFGRVLSNTNITVHDLCEMIQKIVDNRVGVKPTSTDFNVVQEAS